MNDRLWQIIGAGSAVIAILISLVTFYWGQKENERALSAQVLSNSTLLNQDITKADKDLRLVYKDKEIPNIAISQIRISNSGRQPIRTLDIEVPISFNLGNSEIISSKVVSSNPQGLPIDIVNEKKAITVSKILLNPGDEFTVEIVAVPQSPTQPIVTGVSGRIAGIKTISFTDSLRKETRKQPWWVGLLVGISSSFAAIAVSSVFRWIYEYIRRRRRFA